MIRNVLVAEHLYYIFPDLYNQIYSDIFILPIVLTTFMFIYLLWKNKQGLSLKALFDEQKASKIADQMRGLGVTVELQPEIPINDIKVN